MLLVPVKVKYDIHTGTGIYADIGIPKGTRVWEFYPLLDRTFSIAKIQNLPPLAQIFLYKYAWKERKSGLYYLDAGASKYMNRSDTPNLTYGYDSRRGTPILVANKFIKVGIELTRNYKEFVSTKENDTQIWKLILKSAGYNPNKFDRKMFFEE